MTVLPKEWTSSQSAEKHKERSQNQDPSSNRPSVKVPPALFPALFLVTHKPCYGVNRAVHHSLESPALSLSCPAPCMPHKGNSAHLSRYRTKIKMKNDETCIWWCKTAQKVTGTGWQTTAQKSCFVRIIRNLNGSCGSWHVSLVSSHTLAEILLSCLGKRFHKFIPREFLPCYRLLQGSAEAFGGMNMRHP